MFYELHILAKKGALATIWIAAHLEKRLKRQHIVNTDLQQSINLIMNSEAPFALRLSSQLLFGVVRIYQRKVRYLLQDCNDAFGKLREAFVRITLNDTDRTTPTGGLPIPQEFFDLDELSSQFLLHTEPPHENELELFEEALGQDWLGSKGVLVNPEGILLGQEEEFAPLTDEIMNDVMRDMPQNVEIEISPFHELQQPRMSSMVPSERMSSLTEAGRLTGHGLEIQPALPGLDVLPPSPMMPVLDQKLQSTKETPETKLTRRKMKAIVDRKGTEMTDLEYRKMLKRKNRTIQKRKNAINEPDLELKKLDALFERCCVKQIQQSKILGQIWIAQIDKKPEPGVVEPIPATPDWCKKIDPIGSKDLTHDQIPAGAEPDVIDAGGEDFGPSPLRGEIEEFNESSELMEALDECEQMPRIESMEPVGDYEDRNLFAGSPVKNRRSKTQSFSRQSHSVLSFVRNALSFDKSLEEEEAICPSPKRRRLSKELACERGKSISFMEVAKKKSRLNISRWFYELLVLKSHGLVQLQQKGAYDDITITLPNC
eukprot:g8399.t1